MAEIVATAKEISDLSFGVVMLLILVGGYFRWWVWGYQLTDCVAKAKDEISREQKYADRWEQLALEGIATARAQADKLLAREGR